MATSFFSSMHWYLLKIFFYWKLWQSKRWKRSGIPRGICSYTQGKITHSARWNKSFNPQSVSIYLQSNYYEQLHRPANDQYEQKTIGTVEKWCKRLKSNFSASKLRTSDDGFNIKAAISSIVHQICICKQRTAEVSHLKSFLVVVQNISIILKSWSTI